MRSFTWRRRAGVRPSIADPRAYTEVNVMGTVVWLEAASRLTPRPRFIYATSSSVLWRPGGKSVSRNRSG